MHEFHSSYSHTESYFVRSIPGIVLAVLMRDCKKKIWLEFQVSYSYTEFYFFILLLELFVLLLCTIVHSNSMNSVNSVNSMNSMAVMLFRCASA